MVYGSSPNWHHVYNDRSPSHVLCVPLQALGLKPKAAPKALKQPSLEKHEVDKLLKGAGGDEPAALEVERIKGLGFGSRWVADRRWKPMR